MKNAFKAAQVTDRVWWVGAIDWDIRNFHGYLTSRGTTYNAYLVMAKKITLIDTVKRPFKDEMLARIASVVDPGKIDVIISNHAEMDHTGAMPEVIETVRPEALYASKMGARALGEHFTLPMDVQAVAEGEELSLGDAKVTFVETRMCHWPDSMVTYLHGDGVLFSQDAFGMHLASKERFADQLAPAVLDHEAGKYFANILLPMSTFVLRNLEKLAALGLDLRVVAPDHGPIWRRPQAIDNILASYVRWAEQRKTNKAVVIYDTMWESTALMARAIGEGLAEGGATVQLMSMSSCHRSDVATEMLDAAALVVGSPTINSGLFPTLADVLSYLKGLKPANLIGAAFGSFGWSGEGVKDVAALLEQMGVEMVADPLRVRYVPDDAAIAKCRELGLRIAERLPSNVTK